MTWAARGEASGEPSPAHVRISGSHPQAVRSGCPIEATLCHCPAGRVETPGHPPLREGSTLTAKRSLVPACPVRTFQGR